MDARPISKKKEQRMQTFSQPTIDDLAKVIVGEETRGQTPMLI